jgi:hypothetical protein
MCPLVAFQYHFNLCYAPLSKANLLPFPMLPDVRVVSPASLYGRLSKCGLIKNIPLFPLDITLSHNVSYIEWT